MNRLKIEYKYNKKRNRSILRIYNDIKGYSVEQVGETFYGKDADIMFEYFKNSSIRENDKIMLYEIKEEEVV